MLQIETIENFAGFGTKNQAGEFYHSENLLPGQFGLEANISIVDETTANSPSRFTWFAEKGGVDNPGTYAVDTAGKLFYRSGGTWSEVRNPGNSNGNGLIAAEGYQIFYIRDRYLGLYTGSSFFDTYQDFGSTFTGFKPADLYEDWVVIGHGRKIAIYNTQDLSWNANAFTLPPEFEVRAIKSNQTGIIVGANYQNRSVIFLWDVRSVRSISEWIWLDHPIQSICKYGARWIVTTSKEQFITDGYSTAALPPIPDALQQTIRFSCVPAGTMVVGNKLYTANTSLSTALNRLKSGLYIQDLDNGLFHFASVDNGFKSDMVMGAVFENSTFNQFISYTTNLPSAHHVASVSDTSPDFATLISPKMGAGTNNKIAEGVKLDISANPKTFNLNSSGTFTVSLKIYNFKRQLWGYGVTNGASTNANELKVDGSHATRNNATVGDEVTMLSGVNAGQVRHITAIANAGTNTETWTLNANFTSNTESGAYFNVQPFQLVKSKTITITDLSELESIYFDIRNRIKGRKFLVKAVITDISNVSISIPALTFIYDDLGVI